MAKRPGDLPRALGDAFSVRAARGLAVTPGRLRAGDLEAPFRGARMRPAPAGDVRLEGESPSAHLARSLRDLILRRVAALATIAPAGAFFSHATAAVVWGLPVPLQLLVATADRTDLAVLDGRRASKARGVRGHQLRSDAVTVHVRGGIRVSSPASTWAHLADELTTDELVDLGDAIVHIPRTRAGARRAPSAALGTIDQLRAAADAGRRRGVEKLRAAVELIRVGSASPGETRVRIACGRAGLPEPELDIDVFSPSGAFIGCTEIGFARYRVLVEYEGDHHRVSKKQWDRDIAKHRACIDAGWDVVRLTARHAYPTADAAVQLIRNALVRAGWRPGTQTL